MDKKYILIEYSDFQMIYATKNMRILLIAEGYLRSNVDGSAVKIMTPPEECYVRAEGFKGMKKDGYHIYTKTIGGRRVTLIPEKTEDPTDLELAGGKLEE